MNLMGRIKVLGLIIFCIWAGFYFYQKWTSETLWGILFVIIFIADTDAIAVILNGEKNRPPVTDSIRRHSQMRTKRWIDTALHFSPHSLFLAFLDVELAANGRLMLARRVKIFEK
ncbi:MAG: hypothetical protein ISS65_07425 [Desulfobacterales bacterium]|uniref:Uncharacterized protein n=1 Tax=Candidatus Desulfatibia profunda TaxID=2841695 RepID=A0A8J6NJI4_9BACT|nr:hypothetical protein [Candidatus Desulfatibia profunda]MBL7180027.1 hypothetical protein [Desulfobacterales bacterium]